MRQATSRTRAEVQASALEAAKFRLKRHHLLGQPAASEVTLCRDICGAQAQVILPAYLQLWTRNHSLTRAEIEDALWKRRSLIRCSLMRQTLHLIPSDEFPLYITAVRSSRVVGVLRIMSRFGIDREEANALTHLILDCLASGPQARAAINATVRPKVSKRILKWMDRVSNSVRLPLVEGLICHGPGEGNAATFVRVDQWLPKMKAWSLSEAEAQTALLGKYLRAYGPATLNDFAYWSGLPITQVRTLRSLLEKELAEVELEKESCLLLREDLGPLKSSARTDLSVRLLPYFDPYLLAHRAKQHMLEDKHYKRVYRSQWWISPVLLVDGKIAGTWSHKLQGSKVRVTVEPFARLTRATRDAIVQEAESMASFFGGTLELGFNGPGAQKK